MVPLGVFFALLWLTPEGGQAIKFAYYLFVYIGLCLSVTVVSVPYMSLIPEMTRGYDERTSVNTWRSAGASPLRSRSAHSRQTLTFRSPAGVWIWVPVQLTQMVWST